MTDFVDRDSTHLGTDRIFTSPTATAVYENLLAAAQGNILGSTGYFGWAWSKLTESVVSSPVAAVDLTSFVSANYNRYCLEIIDLVAATSGARLLLRVSEDSGSTYKAGASDYGDASQGITASGVALTQTGSASGISLCEASNGMLNTAAAALSGSIGFYNPAGAVTYKNFQGLTNYQVAGPLFTAMRIAGAYVLSVNAINALRLIMSSGNITSGTFRIYGAR